MQRLISLKELDFKMIVSRKTGVVSNRMEATYRYCKIIIYDSGLTLFTGSLHKFYNSLLGVKAPNHNQSKRYKGFNGNQFTLDNIFKVRLLLQKLFSCKASQMIFQNIEFGLNIMLDFDPQLFIKGLLYHNGKQFEYRFNQRFSQVIHQRYILKVYNKSSQYNMDEHTLRVEIKAMKMEELRVLGLKTFADIDTALLSKAGGLILKRFNEIVCYDYTIDKKGLTKLQRKALQSYSNPRYWCIDLKSNLRSRQKKRLQDIIENHSTNLNQKIRDRLIEKCSIINQVSETIKCSIINHSCMGLKVLQIGGKNNLKAHEQNGLSK